LIRRGRPGAVQDAAGARRTERGAGDPRTERGAGGAGKSRGYGRKMLFNYTKDYTFIYLMNMLIYDYYLSFIMIITIIKWELYM
jgi:hypothetical protein